MQENITQTMRDKWNRNIAYCLKHQNKLSEWELGFIDSISDTFSKGNDLSLKQSFKLNDIRHKIEED